MEERGGGTGTGQWTRDREGFKDPRVQLTIPVQKIKGKATLEWLRT